MPRHDNPCGCVLRGAILLVMVCPDCRTAGTTARQVLSAGDAAPTGSLIGVLRGHEKCKGGTWCDCTHQAPSAATART
jgi:hypothetical protein